MYTMCIIRIIVGIQCPFFEVWPTFLLSCLTSPSQFSNCINSCKFMCLHKNAIFFSPNRYYLDSKEDEERLFRIDESHGVIRTTQPLDREVAAWHNITVMASEVGRYPCAWENLIYRLIYESYNKYLKE